MRAALPLPDLDARRDSLRSAILAGVAAGTAVALVIALFVARRLTHPITALTRAATALAEGESGVSLSEHGSDHARFDQGSLGHGSLDQGSNDELGELARSFDRMSLRLRERLHDLESERAKLAVVLEGLAEGVLAVDPQERLLHCNAAARRMLGLPASAAVGRPLVELLRAPEFIAALRLEGGEVRPDGAHSREVRHVEGDREQVLLVRAASLPSGGAVAALLDVTELRRLERVRRDFVANVSHELKTPLAAMRGLVETLVDDTAMEPAVRERFLGKLGAHVQRLSDLATDLLQLARAEADTPARAPVDLAATAMQAVERFASPAAKKPLKLETEIAPVFALVDALALEQVLDNLIDNALKYTPAGGRVVVRTRQDGAAAVLEVADDGIGIEPAEQ
ncbi:MAG: HAMP domain-containing protein [Planctomycetes bacterium]|nr:HAMP domain-containing protein [Planctomycetota bacterium]